jgi:5-methylcytosine-specific restriction endonuclease McrA
MRLELKWNDQWDLLNSIEVCGGCGEKGIVALRYLRWSDLPPYLRGVFNVGWICLECVDTERKKYFKLRSRVETARRRAAEQQAMPKWADKKAIRAVYAEADRLTRETGIPHHVDHVVPLNSPVVSGLHIAANLQVLTAVENIRKSNKLDGIAAKRTINPSPISGYDRRNSPSTRAMEAWQARKTNPSPRLVKKS